MKQLMDNDLSLLQDIVSLSDGYSTHREKTNYMEMDPMVHYPEEAFKRRYRMSKDSFKQLLVLLERDLTHESDRGNPISAEKQILVAIRYYATGSFQVVMGDTIGISQSQVSKIVAKVSIAICSLYKQFIVFPTNQNSANIMNGFYRLLEEQNSRPFPGVIGAIDCTHVEVLAAGVPNREFYRNRKGFLSINVQAICDANLMFTNVVARWPGSVHDSRIFSNSEICARLANNEIRGWLLGDSGYGCKPYLMTPILEPKSRAEHAYNYAHVRSRNVIERAFGVLKKRFACLSGVVRQDLANALTTITACFILHNYLRQRNDEMIDNEVEGTIVLTPETSSSRTAASQEGYVARELLIRRSFS